jgi:hypothetical protein
MLRARKSHRAEEEWHRLAGDLDAARGGNARAVKI